MKMEIKCNFRQELETERLYLKNWQTSFAKDMYNNWATDKEVVKFLSWEPHKNIEETMQIISMWIAEANYNWCIVEKSTNQAIGSINVVRKSDRDFWCEVGYCSSKKVWGRGYMTEALKAVINFLFSEGYYKVQLLHAKENIASGRVMQKAGMTFQGESKAASYVRGKFHDCNVYYALNPNIKLDKNNTVK